MEEWLSYDSMISHSRPVPCETEIPFLAERVADTDCYPLEIKIKKKKKKFCWCHFHFIAFSVA